MMFEKYDAYKDSGVDWIGSIPTHWNVLKLGSIFAQRNEKVSDQDYPALSVTKNGIVPQLDNAAKTKDGDNRKLVLKGDFVINSRSDRKGSSGLSSLDGSVSLINIVLKPRKIEPKFSHHLMKCNAFIEEYYRVGRGIVADLWTTRFEEMKTMNLALPNIEEQRKITEFLDQKTSEIDQAIAIKEQQIALLNERKQIVIQKAVTQGLDSNVAMKDSGLNSVGNIPQDWEIIKFKYLAKVRYGLGQPPRQLDNGLKIIRATNVERGKIVEKGMLYIDPNDIPWDRNPTLNKDEIIVVRSGAYTGDSALVTEEYAGCIAGYDMVATPFNCYPKFLSTVLLSHYVLYEQIYLLRMRSAQPHLNAEELNELQIVVPPMNQQRLIANYIEKVEADIGEAISLIKQQLEKVKEYKTTLINDAVTGKIKVA
ncbi:restriction endonuclease subunit S [Acinetobacter bereziniae]|uniref:Restriction endonuclease subunit S n=1 Tax=Acinetobacter bereziniae TaxID=106648 RepID=A0A8I1AEF3_ACIBZ|nr:restriction endonuclease subunit S [Acinetobacter bereziniae]QQC83620.1 restriction endonuclease subunit S [Acinetobacter bereziniae]UUN96794.1 restriction endonuclease subunit S [Acinetobacter bereziniae]